MKQNKFETLEAISNMAKDNNPGLRMSNTIAEVKKDSRGAIVGFGVEPDIESPAILQKNGLPSSVMCFAFFIDRKELNRYLNK
jgi:hypothetical protein